MKGGSIAQPFQQRRADLQATPVDRLIAGRYRATHRLDQSETSETLLAVNLPTGDSVVVKATGIGRLSLGERMRLDHEASILREIHDPALASVCDAFHEDEAAYLVTPYIEGASLRESLLQGPIELVDALKVGQRLFSALHALHAHRVLHRAVRPANVIVPRPGGWSEAKLVGVGFTGGVQLGGVLRDRLLETARYMSPEQAGSLDCDVGESSDLYSAGVVLFECLSAVVPFQGGTLGELLHQHVMARAPELRSLGVKVPCVVDEVLQRLLRKDPRDRYQSAEAVLADLQAIQAAIARGDGEPRLAVGACDRRTTLTVPAFVGRDAELARLDEQIQRTREGAGALVIVESESGGGKTRLLSEMAQRCARQGLLVLRGQGSNEVGQQPLQVFDGVVSALGQKIASDAELGAALRDRLGVHLGAVVAALPSLAAPLAYDVPSASAPEAFGEARTMQALAHFLDALATPERPAAVVLDDCQWADELTLKLIGHWRSRDSGDGPAPRHVTVVVAFRSEEALSDSPLRRFVGSAHLRLPPFQAEDVERLVESMAGQVPPDAVEAVLRLSDGSPFMASAVLRGMVESGALTADSQGWRIEPLAMADLQSSKRAAALLARRIDMLPPQTIELLSMGAVLGKEFELHAAARMAQQTSSEAIVSLDEARRRHFVWTRSDGAQCAFVHDQIRMALLDRLPSERRKELHGEAALHLQETRPDRVFDLAYHFDAAGKSEQALPFALSAAEQARAQHSLEIAEQQYRIAIRGARFTDRAMQYTIAEGLGDVLMLRGRYDDAAGLFERAAALADGPHAQAQIQGKLGELALKRGDLELATLAFERALRLLGRRVPRRLPAVLLLLAWEVIVQTAHSLFPRWLVGTRRRGPDKEEALAFRLFSRLAHGYWFVRSKPQVLWAHLRGFNLAERHSPTPELAQAYSEHAPAMSLLPWYRRGIDYARRSFEIRTALGDLWGQGQSLHYWGVVLYTASRYEECIEKCREAVRLLERTGDYWEVHTARYQIAASLYRLGRLDEAVEEARRNYESGLALGDAQATGIILDVWSRATGGSVPRECMEREVSRPRFDAQGASQVLLAEGVRLIGAGAYREAAEVFANGVEVADKAGVRNAYVSPNLAWLATAYRLEAKSRRDSTPMAREAALRKAEQAARRAVRRAWWFQNDLPHALRERGATLAMRGEIQAARRMFHKSLAVSERQGARYERAKTLFALGNLGQELGWPNADAQVSHAKALLRELDCLTRRGDDLRSSAAVSLSLVDRFETLLETGRRIASALSAPTIYAEVRDGALRLLRGEHCAILQVARQSDSEQLHLIAGDLPPGVNQTMALRALSVGRTVTFTEEAPDQAAAGDGATVERVALCAPVFVRGRPLACLYVTHQLVRGLFGPDEERVADFIATLAGAALENAEGFEQLQQLNETLEQRVAERIAAAEERARELALSNAKLERITKELKQADEQLRVAKEAAESANRAKSMFLATMSHEIRTPLTGVLGFTELLLAGADEEDAARRLEFLQTIQTCGKHLLCLINDILDLSKIEAGQVEIEPVPCSPHPLIQEVIGLLRVKALEKGLTLEAEWASLAPAEIQTDPARLRQLLMNLVGNALKFTERGGVRLVAEVIGGAAPSLKIDVIDTGIGISADKLECIFDPFVQADNSITRRFGGTGLGLTISRRLARALGGDLTVQSALGKGSRFTLRFPIGPLKELVMTAAGAEAPAASHVAAPSCPSSRLRGARILLVEDGDINRKLVSTVLRRAGAKVHTAENGQWGVDRALAETFDAILMDMQMPVKDGYTAARELRERGLETPIVALTAHAMKGDEQKCREAGCTAYLTKPIDAAALVATIGSLLAPRALAEACGLEALSEAGAAANDAAGDDSSPIYSTLPDDDPEFREVIEQFVAQLPEQLADIQRAVERDDFARVQERAHWLKGTGGTAGFHSLRGPAQRLERAGEQGRTEAALQIVRELFALAARMADALPAAKCGRPAARALPLVTLDSSCGYESSAPAG